MAAVRSAWRAWYSSCSAAMCAWYCRVTSAALSTVACCSCSAHAGCMNSVAVACSGTTGCRFASCFSAQSAASFGHDALWHTLAGTVEMIQSTVPGAAARAALQCGWPPPPALCGLRPRLGTPLRPLRPLPPAHGMLNAVGRHTFEVLAAQPAAASPHTTLLGKFAKHLRPPVDTAETTESRQEHKHNAMPFVCAQTGADLGNLLALAARAALSSHVHLVDHLRDGRQCLWVWLGHLAANRTFQLSALQHHGLDLVFCLCTS